jgi:tetratricopeptide (TPR) repeat protein
VNSRRLASLGLGAVVVAAVLAIYAQLIHFDLVRFDDPQYVGGHRHLREGLSIEGAAWAFSGLFASNYFPLTLLSQMLDRDLFGSDFGGHHLTSAALHAINALLLFAALQRMTRALGPSALVAMLFAVHPLNVESVAWIAERKSVLSTTFWMLTMLAYASYARRGGVGRYLWVALLLAFGLLCKPMLVTLPCVLLLLDYWPLQRLAPPAGMGGTHSRSFGFLIVEKLPLLALSAAASAMTLFAQRATTHSLELLPLGERFANALVSYARYLGKLVWPVDLAMFYPHPFVPQAGGVPLPSWQIAAAAALLVVLSVLVTSGRRRRYWVVGWLWFLGTLVPTIGMVQVGYQAMADRYAYVPAIGLYIAAAWTGVELLERIRRRRPAAARVLQIAALLILIGLLLDARSQARHWSDSVTLFEHTLAIEPRNPTIRYNLANEFKARGELDAAVHHYRVVLDTDPESIKARINLANALRSQGRAAEAIDEYRLVLERQPANPTVHSNLASVLRQANRLDEAIRHYRYAIEVDPTSHSAHYNLANILGSRGELELAVVHYRHALDSNDQEPRIYNNLGGVLMRLARYDEAELAYRRAIELAPDHSRALNNLGLLLARRGELEEAISHYRVAIAARPDYASAHSNLADALSAQGNAAEAIAQYQEALRADPSYEPARHGLTSALRELRELGAPAQ